MAEAGGRDLEVLVEAGGQDLEALVAGGLDLEVLAVGGRGQEVLGVLDLVSTREAGFLVALLMDYAIWLHLASRVSAVVGYYKTALADPVARTALPAVALPSELLLLPPDDTAYCVCHELFVV